MLAWLDVYRLNYWLVHYAPLDFHTGMIIFVALLHVFAMCRFHVRFSDNSTPRCVVLFTLSSSCSWSLYLCIILFIFLVSHYVAFIKIKRHTPLSLPCLNIREICLESFTICLRRKWAIKDTIIRKKTDTTIWHSQWQIIDEWEESDRTEQNAL